MSKAKEKKVNYKALDQRSHVLHRPDMYIGSVKNANVETYVLTDDFKIVKRNVNINHGLVRIFIEALSNAIDNVWRSKEFDIPCTRIKVDYDPETKKITVQNDGLTIPVEMNDQGVYIPDMIFGKLLTSSNYDDNEERKTSGRNGVGITCCNIFSKEFTVDIADTKTGKKYTQTWRNNMEIKEEPKVKSPKSPFKSGYTKVSWIADFERFGLEGYTADILGVMYKKVVDTAMITGINVLLNGARVPVKNIKDYALLYLETEEIITISGPNSDFAITPTNENDYDAISFVNGIETTEGGVHVDSWADAVFRPILDKFNGTKKAGKPQVTMKDVRQFFRIFVNASVTNPEFSSQEKAKLVAPAVKSVVQTKHINSIMKWSVIEKIEDIIRGKELLSLKKTEKKKGFKKIEGLDPANNAGTKLSHECTLILCEGLSAKTYAVLGIEVGAYGKKGRDFHGILPLRGKVLNVRNASTLSITKNKEVTDVIQALGIRYGVDYSLDENYHTLNYGRVMLLCDSDVDGLHISGLIINLFHSLFPSIMSRKFIVNMKTPLVRIYMKNEQLSFYNLYDFNKWAEKNHEHKGRVKYFKGLGTSSDKEVRDSFGKRIVEYVMDHEATETIDKVFNQKYADRRKQWIEEYDPTKFPLIEYDAEPVVEMPVSDFIDHEMITFSIDDCKRSIPSMMDGLKESQRKILYATLLKKLKHTGKAIKVAQLAGFVAEKTNYHHGEQCLFDTITKLAHNFIGSNNIPLLFRDGQFGSRLNGGKDAASARYIFTKLDTLTRLIFREEDDVLLQRVVDDGEEVEPVYYAPIIPMILVNGCTAGIGTGWSSSVPSYDPLDIVNCVRCYITKTACPDIKPWYRGFTGTIYEESPKKYVTVGRVEKEGKNSVVTELPVGLWTDRFKEYVEDLVESKILKSYKNYSTPEKVRFVLTEAKDGIKCNEETLKLKTKINTTNMVLFSSENRIKKYDTVYDIISEFCDTRIVLYRRRKEHILSTLEKELSCHNNKYRFIQDVMDDRIVLRRRDETDIIKDLEKSKYDKHYPSSTETIEELDEKDNTSVKGYRYLLDMKMRSFTLQRLEELKTEIDKLSRQVKDLKKKSEVDLWLSDLKDFETQYAAYCKRK
jgi:DNA topoisomerase-2